MKLLFSSVIILLLVGAGAACAQDGVSEFRQFRIMGIGSVPVGGFGKKIAGKPQVTRRQGFNLGDGASLATTGFGLEAEFAAPTGIEGLGWVFNLNFLLNGVDNASVTSAFKQSLGDTVDVTFDSGRWINLPLMTGFRYGVPVSSTVAVYGTVQGGVNLILAPSRTISVSGVVAEKSTFDLAREFGYGVGIGVAVGPSFRLEVRYLDWGSVGFGGTKELTRSVFPEIAQESMTILGEQMPVSMILVGVGVAF